MPGPSAPALVRRARIASASAAALAACLLAALAPPAAASPAPADASVDTALVQAALDQAVAAGAPGVSARITDGTEVHRLRSGVGDLDTGAPVPLDGRFRPASLTKSLVAVVVLQLVDEGRLELDEPVGALLPGVLPEGSAVSVRQLLNHTSGLPDYISDPLFAHPRDYTGRSFTPGELVGIALAQPVRPPGEFAYSNTNYILLGMLVEQLTDAPLPTELQRRVLRPTGMRHSYLPVTFPRILGPHATGYYRGADDAEPTETTELNPSFAWASYGLVSTSADLGRFYRALLDGTLLPGPLLDEMRTTVPTGHPIWPGYGLGLEQVTLTCGEMWGHTGSIPGYMTIAFATPDGGRHVVLSMNLQWLGAEVGTVLLALIDASNRALCGEPFELDLPGAPTTAEAVERLRPLDMPAG
ncbi:serine hydrolase domain-containing protein [Allonocardiopsis opalescens]|uniref:D-alanyl-D-alanine carboxypeptidase n=1 Tax=Allonocardiopsis opalescens TaxID=1144618 RepID=A0A2T0Q9T6_9ACTN|nr:serine hydrolase domain-containing protein [Allonocardiopsis opalescens]PRY00624.1 D-alanyl-D-alanine carboxypeptidase [Allonocardiopsis opalescens]